MSLSSTLRFSSLLHRLPPPSLRYFSFLHHHQHHRSVSDLRFFSSSSPRIRPVVQSRRRDETPTDDSENGSLLVKDSNGGSPGGGNGRFTGGFYLQCMNWGFLRKSRLKNVLELLVRFWASFHPHGDTAVYDALVRMAQDFSLRCPLIQGHGNFGSVDADPPAAMRYTECRLDGLTEAVFLADLEQDTVDFVPNFDNSQKEPSLFPTRLPTLLLNGSSGIAVGMATKIPPHNLGELVDVLCALIHNPDATLQELLEYMPGPDFPTGGIIMGNQGILDAYRSGQGRIVVRGKTDVELLDSKTKRSAVIIKEIPYQTNKASLVEKIAELVEDKNLDGISDIRDESDRSGMRIVIELKRGCRSVNCLK
ncbi:DNA GYRASE/TOPOISOMERASE SUBUNIT A [Salix viminalis]|uniref:DNA GYRASE/TOPOISOMERASE SUBUNIT A n=1 Tax=Salix viminalis TaxID=40686 RepID=A0A9Q0TYE3_SALVM|nr:DNA GYRASE/TOPOISOMERASE SUBUNIT A [Salix viminalis]